MIDFRGPNLKIERANHHIHELEAIFHRHVIESKKRLRPKRNGKPRPLAGIGLSFPRHTSTILGDAIHNLRAALDHAYCILIEANGHAVSHRTFFPFVPDKPHLTVAESVQNVKASVQGHVCAGNGPNQRVIDFIFDVLQPYQGGRGEDLKGLHDLDISDKHMVLLPTRFSFGIDSLTMTNHAEKKTISTTGIGFDFGTGGGAGFNLITFPEGYVLDNEKDLQGTFDITFEEGQPFERQGIIPTLKKLKVRVEETVAGLKDVGAG